jgi:hypothetical protein
LRVSFLFWWRASRENPSWKLYIFRIWVRNIASSSPAETSQDEANSRTGAPHKTAHRLPVHFCFA